MRALSWLLFGVVICGCSDSSHGASSDDWWNATADWALIAKTESGLRWYVGRHSIEPAQGL